MIRKTSFEHFEGKNQARVFEAVFGLDKLNADDLIKAIKKAGGMIIVRNPVTSDFSSMPSQAIATGMVDYILEPELMPDTIQDYVKLEG